MRCELRPNSVTIVRLLLEQKMNYAIQARDAKVLVLRILPKVSGYKRHDAYNDLLMGIFNTPAL